MSGLSVPASKIYDGTTTAVVSGTSTLASAEAAGAGTTSDGKSYTGDTVSITGATVGTYNFKDVATATTVTYSGLSLTGSQAGNYTLTTQSPSAATITAKAITVTGTTASGKAYDGGRVATINTTSSVLTDGATAANDNKYYTGDTVALVKTSATGSYATKDAGTNKPVTVVGFTLSGADAGNYSVTDASGATATIRAVAVNLTVTGLEATSRVYDGTTNIALTGTATITIIGSDDVVLGGTPIATMADKAVGVNKEVTVTGNTISGADAGNYNLIQQQGLTATITAKAITVTGTTATGKVYDGALTATISTASSVLTNGATAANDNKYYSTDTVVLEKALATGSYATKDAGTNKPVTVTGFTLSGTDAGNYTVTDASGATATITAKPVIVTLAVTGLQAISRVYDGTTNIALTGTATINLVGSDDVVLGGTPVATMADKAVGLNKPVTVTGNTLSGADAGNYNLIQQQGLTATITAKDISLVGLTATNKVYDGNVVAAISNYGALSGIVGADDVGVNSSTSVATFTSPDAGTAKFVNVHGLSLTGIDATNYSISDQMTTGDITSTSVLPPLVVTTPTVGTSPTQSAQQVTSSSNEIFVKTSVSTKGYYEGRVIVSDSSAEAVYSALLASSAPLPSWIDINSSTGVITCRPPENVTSVELFITAILPSGKILTKHVLFDFVTGKLEFVNPVK